MLYQGLHAKKITQIDQYKIIETLGQGGMGIVYKGYNVQTKQIVAIKCMLSTIVSKASSKQRFEREMRNTLILDHPNIVKVLEIGTFQENPYIVMEYIKGVSISDYFAGKTLQIPNKLEMIKKIAHAIKHAHDNKIIHRDLKPDNILVKENGTPVLMDFGLAKSFELEDKSLTKTGQVLGTPKYMSPEQALGLKRSIDYQTDIYGLGAVFYNVLTGDSPFQGDTLIEVARAVLKTKIKKPRTLNPKIPKAVEEVCLKALEKKKSRRYKSIMQFSKDINACLKKKKTEASQFYFRQSIKKALIIVGCLFFSILSVFLFTRLPQKDKILIHYTNYKKLLCKNLYIKAKIELDKASVLIKSKKEKNKWLKKLEKAELLFSYNYAKFQQYKSNESCFYLLRAFELSKKYKIKTREIQIALAENYFNLGYYKKAYEIATQGKEKQFKISQNLTWIIAQSAYYLEKETTLYYLLKTIKNTFSKDRKYIKVLYLLGKCYLRSAQYEKARKAFKKILPLMEKAEFAFTSDYYLSFSRALLFLDLKNSNNRAILKEAQHYLSQVKEKEKKQILYKETLARYYLKKTAFIQIADQRRILGEKIVVLINLCMEKKGENAEYYYIRARGYSLCKKYARSYKDYSAAIELAPHNIDIFRDRLDMLRYYINPYDFQNFIEEYYKHFSLNHIKPNLFLYEYKMIRKKYSKEVSQSIPFSQKKLLFFLKTLETKSKSTQQFAEQIICSMYPQKNVIQFLKTQQTKKKTYTELINKIHHRASMLKNKRFLYKLANMNPTGSMKKLEIFKNKTNREKLKTILQDENQSPYLRFLAARVMGYMDLKSKVTLYNLYLNSKRKKIIPLAIITAKVLTEMHVKVDTTFFSHLFIEDEFLQSCILEILPKDIESIYLKKVFARSSYRLNAIIAKRFINFVDINFRTKLLNTILNNIKKNNHNVQSISLLSLWSEESLKNKAMRSTITNHFHIILKMLESPSSQLQYTAIHCIINLHNTQQFSFFMIKQLRYHLTISRKNRSRNYLIMALAISRDLRFVIENVLLSKNSNFSEYMSVVTGYLKSHLIKKNQFFRLKSSLQIFDFLKSNIDKETQSILLYSMKVASKLNWDRNHISKFLKSKVLKLLHEKNQFALTWGLLSTAYLQKIPQHSVQKLYTLWKKHPDKRIQSLAFGVLVHFKMKGFTGHLKLETKQTKRNDLMRIWGNNLMLARSMILYIPDYVYSNSEPSMLKYMRFRMLYNYSRKQSIRQRMIVRMRQSIYITKNGKRYHENFRDCFYKFCFLCGSDPKYATKAIEKLIHFCKKESWKDLHFIQLLTDLVTKNSYPDAIQLLDQLLKIWKQKKETILLGCIIKLHLHLNQKKELEMWFLKQYGFSIHSTFILSTLFKEDIGALFTMTKFYRNHPVFKPNFQHFAMNFRILRKFMRKVK